MANAKEMQIARDAKISECLDLLKLIVDHLGLDQQEEQSSDSEGAE
jgi:hypothetical protein